jgi:F-box-like
MTLDSNRPPSAKLLPALDGFLDRLASRIQGVHLRSSTKTGHLPLEDGQAPSLKAPINHIPAEILAKIIHWAIGGPGSFADHDTRLEFLRLRRVSPIWRRTALTTPYLWRYLLVDTNKDFGKDPHRAMMKLKRLIPQWFGRAGVGAEVHLDLGGWMDASGRRSFDWEGVIWGPEERSYRLATVRFRGDIVAGSDVRVHRPMMSTLRNFSINADPKWGTPDYPLNLDAMFPSVESLTLQGETNFPPLVCLVNIRSLFLSHLTFDDHGFAMALRDLTRLEELIIHNSICTGEPNSLKVVNTSIERLVCPASTLLRWPAVKLSSLKFYKMVRNTVHRFDHVVDGRVQTLWDDGSDFFVPFVGDILSSFNSHNLTIDLTSIDIDLDNLVMFLQRCNKIQTLLMETLAPLFADETLAQEWRSKPNITNIISLQYVDPPRLFAAAMEPSQPSSPPTFSVISPQQSADEREATYLRCSEPTLTCTIDFSRLPQWKIDSMVQEELHIRSHDYEELIKEITPHRWYVPLP